MTKQQSRGRDFVYLASSSPRRRELIAQLGLRFEVVPAEVDESRQHHEIPADFVKRLALAKGRAALSTGKFSDAAVVSADTVVVIGDDILGKPSDNADAINMLTRLSGRTHKVYSAVAVMTPERETVECSLTSVRFRTLQESEIERYCRTGEPADKAGAYGIQGLGAVFIEDISGSYSGVVGLPLCETARLLAGFGYCLP